MMADQQTGGNPMPSPLTTASLLTQAQQALDASLAALPPHRTGAAVVTVRVVDGKPTAQLGVAARIGDHWQVDGWVAYSGTVSAGADVLFAWGSK